MKKNKTIFTTGKIEEKSYSEYKSKIEKMNMAELQDHAISMGLKPSTYRHILEKSLLNLYNKKPVPFYQEDGQALAEDKQAKIDKVLSSWR